MNTLTTHTCPRHGAGLYAALAQYPARLWRAFDVWHARTSQRRALAALTPERLRDIGITPRQARAEAEKPFWRS